jgi:hypothetical protein
MFSTRIKVSLCEFNNLLSREVCQNLFVSVSLIDLVLVQCCMLLLKIFSTPLIYINEVCVGRRRQVSYKVSYNRDADEIHRSQKTRFRTTIINLIEEIVAVVDHKDAGNFNSNNYCAIAS